MKISVLIAALIIGALLCSGFASAEKPDKETVYEIKFVHYQDGKDIVKEKALPAKQTRTPKPTVTAAPTPAANEEPAPTPTVSPTPTVTATPTPTATSTPVQSGLFKINGKKWIQFPVQWYVNPNVPDLNADQVTQELVASLDAWDGATGSDLIEYAGTTDSPAGWNGRSETYWANITDTRIIAMASVFVNSTAIIEADIQMNSNKAWGIDQDGEGAQYTLVDRFDIRNIATHEAGHAFGLGDLYESSAIDLTMYGYSARGQTKKISLGLGDILGIQALYGV